MSTRCQVLVTDNYGMENKRGILFYRHSDGYPSGVRESLRDFLALIKDGYIRNNAEQSSGWLIMVGNAEYHEYSAQSVEQLRKRKADCNLSGWKVGAYEPAECVHGDIEYFYVVNVETQTVIAYKTGWNDPRNTVKKFLSDNNGVPFDVFSDNDEHDCGLFPVEDEGEDDDE